MTVNSSKVYGPKGIGALFARRGISLVPLVPGEQEAHRRGGTENLPAIAGMAAALELLGDLTLEAQRLAKLRDLLEAGLLHALPETHIWGREVARLPGSSYLRFGQLQVEVVLQRLGTLGVAASSGAACSSGGNSPSHVLRAMGVPAEEALAAVRLSLGHNTTLADVNDLLRQLPPLLAPLLREEPTTSSTWNP